MFEQTWLCVFVYVRTRISLQITELSWKLVTLLQHVYVPHERHHCKQIWRTANSDSPFWNSLNLSLHTFHSFKDWDTSAGRAPTSNGDISGSGVENNISRKSRSFTACHGRKVSTFTPRNTSDHLYNEINMYHRLNKVKLAWNVKSVKFPRRQAG